jgi:Cu2+-containing amine oxidase
MKRLFGASALVLIALLAHTPNADAAGPHPMDPLTAEEIIAAATILTSGGAAQPGAIFQAVDLREPARTRCSASTPGTPCPGEPPCSSVRTRRASRAR